ncbi:MAG: Hsp33 family molecular chaperone HslO [Desulfobacterales bacterium]|nr:Hsp33 family molecular chaperone HslO [Desulfobacterales bacterium]
METRPTRTREIKDRLKAASRDRLYRFVLKGGQARGALVSGTFLIQKMRRQHQLGILETLVLGHAYLGALLMAASIKGDERVTLQIDCAGPIKGLVVETNARLEVRGYLKRVPIPVDRPLEDFNLAPFFGAGLLRVTRELPDAKQPFSGTVDLKHGNLAEDLTYYFLSSEQVHSAFNLSVQFDRQGHVIGAGGLFLQRMPGCGEGVVGDMERIIQTLPPLGKALAEGREPQTLIADEFAALQPVIRDSRRVDFFCPCSRKRFERLLALLPADDLADLQQNGPFPVELRCNYCNRSHAFTRAQMAVIGANPGSRASSPAT